MDITNFMSWFINQVVNMFTWFFGILDSITFAGTSLLKVCITVSILGILIPVLLTIAQNFSIKSSPSERVESSKKGDPDHRARIN